jgi:HD-like signal output (HDOD) protein
MSDNGSGAQGNLRSLDLRLPPLPQTLPQVLELLHAPGFVTAEDLGEVVQGDPAAVARLLKHINSAYYGLRRSITDVERAIRMMGPTTASGTIISLCMLEMSEMMEGPAESCFQNLLRHSEGTAFLARHLLEGEAPQRGEESPAEGERPGGDGFTEGLLHDFGKLVLIYNYPEKAVSIYEDKVFEEYLSETNQRVLEQLVFGCDHTEAGGYAASEMNFPRTLIDVIRYHHNPDEQKVRNDSRETVWAVSAANLATKAMGSSFVGVHPTETATDWETCAADPIWNHFLDVAEEGEEDPSMQLMEELSAKRKDIVLFTKFFLNPDIPDPAQQSN